VALLSGRNFETKQFEEEIARQSFESLKEGVFNFMSKTNFERLTMILRSAGFISNSLISSKNAIDFAFVLYLLARKEGIQSSDIEQVVRKWFVMSMLTGRYSMSPESSIDQDVRQLRSYGVKNYSQAVFDATLTDSFWSATLPQEMDTSSSNSPYFLVYLAAQVKMKDKGFLSRDIEVSSLLLNRADVHHLFPRNFLKQKGLQRGQYNQIANYAVAQSEINIAIGDKPPKIYFATLLDQVTGGPKKLGGLTDQQQLLENLHAHCIPDGVFNSMADDYEEFLVERRKLMALKIRDFFSML